MHILLPEEPSSGIYYRSPAHSRCRSPMADKKWCSIRNITEVLRLQQYIYIITVKSLSILERGKQNTPLLSYRLSFSSFALLLMQKRAAIIILSSESSEYPRRLQYHLSFSGQ